MIPTRPNPAGPSKRPTRMLCRTLRASEKLLLLINTALDPSTRRRRLSLRQPPVIFSRNDILKTNFRAMDSFGEDLIGPSTLFVIPIDQSVYTFPHTYLWLPS